MIRNGTGTDILDDGLRRCECGAIYGSRDPEQTSCRRCSGLVCPECGGPTRDGEPCQVRGRHPTTCAERVEARKNRRKTRDRRTGQRVVRFPKRRS